MSSYRALYEESLAENRPEDYRALKASGELKALLDSVAQTARDSHRQIVKNLAERHPYNPVEWAPQGRGAWEGWLERTAEELVLHDLILVQSPEDARADLEGYTD